MRCGGIGPDRPDGAVWGVFWVLSGWRRAWVVAGGGRVRWARWGRGSLFWGGNWGGWVGLGGGGSGSWVCGWGSGDLHLLVSGEEKAVGSMSAAPQAVVA